MMFLRGTTGIVTSIEVNGSGSTGVSLQCLRDGAMENGKRSVCVCVCVCVFFLEATVAKGSARPRKRADVEGLNSRNPEPR